MKLYKGTICSIILVGTLNEPPLVYKLDDATQAAEFFLTIYKATPNLEDNNSEEQFFLYRIIAKNSEALKIKNHARSGIQLFVEGELLNYHVMQSSQKDFVIADVAAHKLWFANSSELNPLEMKHENLKPHSFSRNIIDISRSQYLH
jgi:hypothetical protein